MFSKQFIRSNVLLIVSIFYAISVTAVMSLTKNDSIMKFNSVFTVLVSFAVTCQVLNFVIKIHDKGIRLYTALGICCLALGNLYFILLNIVSISPDILSVGTFAKVCCYLFFISALTSLKKITLTNKIYAIKNNTISNIAINTISVISTIACAFSVISNNLIVVNLAVVLLDLLCIILAVGLIKENRTRFFAIMMLVISSFDIFHLITFLAVFIDSLSPALYVFLAKSLMTLEEKEGDEYA